MNKMLRFFVDESIRWIQRQRDMLREEARSLNPKERKMLAPYFAGDTLDAVRIAFVPANENPDFYQRVQQMEYPTSLDFRAMWGITFIDTIAAATSKIDENSECWIPFLFHECVHVCQYHLLGLQSFMERYIGGWAEKDFKYRNIPLEGNAYCLQCKFETEDRPFSVEESVQEWL
jgi:hypothetical protein